MRLHNPLELVSRVLSDIEDRWVPYSSLWWRMWTPPMGREDRYQDGYFNGYVGDDLDEDESLSDLPITDIRRLLAKPVIRHIYRKLPYIWVDPIKRPYDEMGPEERTRRREAVTEITLDAYRSGKALYPRSTIQSIEEQIDAAAKRIARRRKDPGTTRTRRRPHLRIRHTLFSYCQAPNTMFVSFPSLDGFTTHMHVLAPGAHIRSSEGLDVEAGRPQIEFRSIQELVQFDPVLEIAFEDQYAPDSWVPSVGYHPITVADRPDPSWLAFTGEFNPEDLLSPDTLRQRFADMKRQVRASTEWRAFVQTLDLNHGIGSEVLRHVDKLVFFYHSGLAEQTEYHRRAMYIFALATCLREWVQALGGRAVKDLPIYMPSTDLHGRWNDDECQFLSENGVKLIDSNGRLFLLIDDRTIVLSYRSWNPVKQVVADLARPAALVCHTVSDDEDFEWKEEDPSDTGEGGLMVPVIRSRKIDEHSILVDPDSPRVRKMLQDYVNFGMPELPTENEPEEPISLYVRRPGVDTEVDYW
jgi:hypothetical protein